MSYAVETKKRKFDRILEQLTQHSTPSRALLNTRSNASTVSLVVDETESAKKRRITPNSSSQLLPAASTTSLLAHYLPSDRTAFLERLETFRQVTKWHVPSTESINAAAWAKQGWACVDTDLVSCGSCKEQILVQIDSEPEDSMVDSNDDSDDQEESHYEMAAELHQEVVKKFHSLIVNGHKETCSWRKRGCDSSIQRIEGLLNTSNAISALHSRYKSILEIDSSMPAVDFDHIQDTGQELREFHFEENDEPLPDTLAMAMCGWCGRDEEVVECRNCFRSLGLWLYKGSEPTIERLDPIEGHLEYCPWRSPETQETETVLAGIDVGKTEHKNRKVAGWELVYQAMVKDNKKRGSKRIPADPAAHQAGPAMEEATPEQQEQRMKDLFRRLKESKKSFNVKSLLKRKDKTKT